MSDNETLKKAGEYRLDICTIISYRTDPDNASRPLRLDVQKSLISLSLIEDITMPCVHGELTLLDNTDVRTLLPLTGNERLEVRFWTPSYGAFEKVAALEGITEPFYIYKMDRVVPSPGGTSRGSVIRIMFTTREAYRNNTCRVSQAFEGPVENGFFNIMYSDKYLDSRKRFFIEETKTNTKMVMPTVKPFEAIQMLAASAVSKNYKAGGYLHFETLQGIHFRSIESLMAVGGATARPVKRRFRRQQANVKDPGGNTDIMKDMEMVRSYSFDNPVDIMTNIDDGVLANRLIVHNAFDKTFTTTDFDYHKEFGNYFHTEHEHLGTKTAKKYTIPFTTFDGTKKTLSEYPEAYVSLKSSTSAIHNDYESVPATLADQSSISQRGLMLTHNLILNVPGDTNLHAGDMINFELPYQKPVEEGEKQELNPYWAGRYLIISLKHIIDQTSQEHMMAIRCVKDSTLNRLPDQTESHLINHRTKTKHQVWSINKMDEEWINQNKPSIMSSGPPGRNY